jgi:lipopolysaccharide transport system ATP-binding protein
LIAGTARASEGRVTSNGRALALLDLSTGFAPELTGRMNIDYVARLVGYDTIEARERTPAIIEFAELGEFIDHPVRTYSTGMFLRLAFAVYAGLDPRMLLVDEALAVGDVAFQRRCLRRIEELRAQHGTAILLVSHDLALVTQFCQRAVVLDHGALAFDGRPRDAVETLQSLLFHDGPVPARADDDSIASGDGGASIADVWAEDASGRRTATVPVGTALSFCYRIRFHCSVDQPVLGFRLATVQGIVLSSANTYTYGYRTASAVAGDEWEVRWQLSLRLVPGSYFLSCGCSYSDRDVFLCRRVDALKLTVIGQARGVGIVDSVSSLTVQKVDTVSAQRGVP